MRHWAVNLTACAAAIFAASGSYADSLQPGGAPKVLVSASSDQISSIGVNAPLAWVAGGEALQIDSQLENDSMRYFKPGIGLNLTRDAKSYYDHVPLSTAQLKAKLTEDKARLEARLARNLGYGLLPAKNFVQLGVGASAEGRSVLEALGGSFTDLNTAPPVSSADVGAQVFVQGRPFAGVTRSETSTGLITTSLNLDHPFEIPVSISLSQGERLGRPDDDRVMIRVIKTQF